ncbi:uncharacterized protein C18H10.09 [Nephila pilipes]|uniref:Nucleoporin NUP42 n=1 Tax=Nephila pilipes TaxID=299642 RepID=A0A8X6TI35_NEPPI|nr:uncharacterized protein C18H10.09 [Nephila pilipes]
MITDDEKLNNIQDLNIELNKSEVSTSSYSQNQVSNLCYFYSNYGYCKYGQSCKFLHRKKNYSSKKSTQKEFCAQKYNRRNYVTKKALPFETRNTTSIQTKHNSSGVDRNLTKRPCRYFKAGHCEKEESCLYSHNVEKSNINSDFNKLSQSMKDLEVDISTKFDSKRKSIPYCYYFKRGFCQKGDKCKYYHNPKHEKLNLSHDTILNEKIAHQENENNESLICQKTSGDKNSLLQSVDVSSRSSENIVPNATEQSSRDESFIDNSEQSTYCEDCISNSEEVAHSELLHSNCNTNAVVINQAVKNRYQASQPVRAFKLSSLSEDEIHQLRTTEITQLKKRFPKHEENISFSFDFEPSDPDWPYDWRMLNLVVTFPENYPLEVCEINVHQCTDYIPGIVLRHLNQSIYDWLNEKHAAAQKSDQVILLFRPFLKWFDKSLEELFNNGFKKVNQMEGDKSNEILITPENVSLNGKDALENSPDEIPDSTEQEKPALEFNQDASIEKNNQSMNNFSQLRGVKVLFIGLELAEGVAALSCKKLATTIHCIRCKTSCNLVLLPNKNLTKVCAKCSKSMELNFIPSILHQFSSVLGNIHLLECQAVDVNLVESAFLLDCLNCSKQITADGLHYGQKQKLWCRFCNQKLILSIESVKFQATVSTIAAANKTIDVKKTIKKKDPVIKEGCPLPDLGTCKHYKKSYRWLRFPCCGRLYPCDICHDEKEIDHDMKFASRMVCGYCSKEQPYSKDKPCFSCSSNVVNKSGSFWEGGKGCRNSITMSRGDKHKYSGMNKTTSKKSQPTGKKKK